MDKHGKIIIQIRARRKNYKMIVQYAFVDILTLNDIWITFQGCIDIYEWQQMLITPRCASKQI